MRPGCTDRWGRFIQNESGWILKVRSSFGTQISLIGFLVCTALALPALAQSRAAQPDAHSLGIGTRYLPDRFAGSAGRYYKAVWGVDSLSVKTVESGQIIRFSWRVLDPERAQALSDKTLEPALIDPQAGVSLVIPTVQNIGMLRQTSSPEAGQSYWMAFSNKGRLVKRGHRVNVVIGTFRAEGLVVD
jgi:hypothetical protein